MARRRPTVPEIDFEKLFQACGGRRVLAEALDLDPSSLRKWVVVMRAVPIHQAQKINKLFGVPLHEMRPDVWDEPARSSPAKRQADALASVLPASPRKNRAA